MCVDCTGVNKPEHTECLCWATGAPQAGAGRSGDDVVDLSAIQEQAPDAEDLVAAAITSVYQE